LLSLLIPRFNVRVFYVSEYTFLEYLFMRLLNIDGGTENEEIHKEVIIGIVTHIDLLHYISGVEQEVRQR